jgi:hypothetical protein
MAMLDTPSARYTIMLREIVVHRLHAFESRKAGRNRWAAPVLHPAHGVRHPHLLEQRYLWDQPGRA